MIPWNNHSFFNLRFTLDYELDYISINPLITFFNRQLIFLVIFESHSGSLLVSHKFQWAQKLQFQLFLKLFSQQITSQITLSSNVREFDSVREKIEFWKRSKILINIQGYWHILVCLCDETDWHNWCLTWVETGHVLSIGNYEWSHDEAAITRASRQNAMPLQVTTKSTPNLIFE